MTVKAPTLKPVTGSPQAVVTAYVHALDSRNLVGTCLYTVSADLAARKSTAVENGNQLAMPPGDTYNGFAVGYALIDGHQALVGARANFAC